MKVTEEIQKGESKTLELKEQLPKNSTIAKTIVAFSNTTGGKLMIGVDDKRNIVGIDDSELFAMQDKIASIISDRCSPSILPEIYSLNIADKLLLVIEVVRGNLKPYFLKNQGKSNGTYIRIGATNRKADLEHIDELERQKRHISFDAEISYETTYEDLDISPLSKQFEKLDKPLNEEKLKNLKLIKTENNTLYPTRALMILLGKFPHCSVKCARFKGTTMDVFIDKKEYTGDIFSILENTQNFILNHINLGAKIEGLYREEAYEVPKVAIREALINAIIHRDYVNRGRDIKVGIYDDVINIVSPGCLPSNITIEDIFNGRSESRNRVIATIFKELNLIEQWGSGIQRIVNSCREYDLATPKIQEKNDFMDIEIVRRKENSQNETNQNERKRTIADENDRLRTNTDDPRPITTDYDRLRPIVTDYDHLDKEEKDLLIYLLDHSKITRKEAVRLLDLGETKTKEIFNRLIAEDLILRKGKGRTTYYTINQDNN